MNNATAWDVYLKTQELSSNKQDHSAIPIGTIAEALHIGANLAEQYAICLQLLDVVQFDANRKEIALPGFQVM